MTNLQLDERLQGFLTTAINQKASDIHIISGTPAVIRRESRLFTISDQPLSADVVAQIIKSSMSEDRYKVYLEKHDLDYSFGIGSVRVRANAYFEKGNPGLALRLVPVEIPAYDTLGIPQIVVDMAKSSQGFILITGPTGHGKSTTLASMVEHINATRSEHIITLEDPVEYIFSQKKSIISQREVGSDTVAFSDGLRAALREDPNVILVGEMRDLETIETALTLAETGHLVLSTLHTNSASQTADRVIDVFPAYKQPQIRAQFANVLLGLVSQRLLPKINGGRVLVSEVVIANPAIRNLIREGKTHQMPSIIQTSASEGMVSLDKRLAELVTDGTITVEEALAWSLDPKSLKMQLYH